MTIVDRVAYVVMYGSYEGVDLWSDTVFATAEEADKYAKDHGLEPADGIGGYYVEELHYKDVA